MLHLSQRDEQNNYILQYQCVQRDVYISIEKYEKEGGGRTELFQGLQLGFERACKFLFHPKRLEIWVPSKQKK